MNDRKSKRGSDNNIEVDAEDMNFILEPTQVEVGSGYTVAVSYDEHEKPVIDIKTYGQVDVAQLRREIARVFPDAQIRKLDQISSVTVVRTRPRKGKSKKK